MKITQDEAKKLQNQFRFVLTSNDQEAWAAVAVTTQGVTILLTGTGTVYTTASLISKEGLCVPLTNGLIPPSDASDLDSVLASHKLWVESDGEKVRKQIFPGGI